MVQLNSSSEKDKIIMPTSTVNPDKKNHVNKIPLKETTSPNERRSIDRKKLDPRYHHHRRPPPHPSDRRSSKPPRHNPHAQDTKENNHHRREPLGGEDRLPPSKRRSPRHYNYRPDSPASLASAPSSVRRNRPGGYQYPDHHGPSRDTYDPQMYYYYQKMWEPYYKDYYRQYVNRSAYSTAGDSILDDKASTRSGRSSVNDEMKKSSMSSQFRQDFLGHTSLEAYEPSPIYPDQGRAYDGRLKSYPSGEISGIPSVTGDEAVTELNQRISPLFFNGPHLAAKFTPGGKLLLVLPSDPKVGEAPRVQLRNVQKMLCDDPHFERRIQNMKFYPGPLTANETHKDVVIKFCLEKSRSAIDKSSSIDRESVVLFWEYLSLLVKQNGKVCGVDLAKLLLKGTETNFPSVVTASSAAIVVPPTEEARGGDNNGDGDSSSPHDEGIDVNNAEQVEQIETFVQYLCLGRKREAVDYAITEGLWGYAMTLASKMDSATLARVMAAFMNSIPKTDVLHTLIQHLSGKKPEVSKNYSSERWGDWRQHLAMIVSNPTLQLQRDRASISALGDVLAAKHRFHAAHLCYLAAEERWGTYDDKESKLVLLGSSHQHQSFQMFTSEEAIQATEIYEFAKSQDGSSPSMTDFQSYKLIYALRLAECGFSNEALKYCEVLSQVLMKDPASFKQELISQVLDLASQLKYHDVHYQMCEGEVSEMKDPDWIQGLQNTLYNLQYEALNNQQSAGVEDEQEVVVPPDESPVIDYHQDQLYQQSFTSASHNNNSDLNLSTNYEPASTKQEPVSPESEIAAVEFNHNVPPIPIPSVEPISQSVELNNEDRIISPPHTNKMEYQEMVAPPPSQYLPEWQQSQNHHQQQQSWHPDNQQQTSWQQQQPEPQQNISPQHHSSWHQPEPTPQWEGSESPREASSEDTLDASVSPSSVVRSEEEQQYWNMMSGKGGVSNDDGAGKPQEKNEKQDETKESKEKPDAEKKSSFFGSIFGWRKNNNVAKLPDDKNPSIIWDEQKQTWINTDGDDQDIGPPPPPPPGMTGPPTNFRGGNRAKSRYVDPVGDKGRTRPGAAVPAAPMMLPQKAPPLPAMGLAPQQPLMEPASFGAHQEMPQQPETLSGVPPREPDTPSGSIPMMGAPGGPQNQPMFFNPSQMKPTPNQGPQQPKRTGPSRRVFNQR